MPKLQTQKERMIERIQSAMVLDRLIKHYNGEVDLSATQVRVGLALLAKQLPDLKAMEVEQRGEHNVRHSLDDKSVEKVLKRIKTFADGNR